MPKIHFVARGLLLVAGDELTINMKIFDFNFKNAVCIYLGVAFVSNLNLKVQVMHRLLHQSM